MLSSTVSIALNKVWTNGVHKMKTIENILFW